MFKEQLTASPARQQRARVWAHTRKRDQPAPLAWLAGAH